MNATETIARSTCFSCGAGIHHRLVVAFEGWMHDAPADHAAIPQPGESLAARGL